MEKRYTFIGSPRYECVYSAGAGKGVLDVGLHDAQYLLWLVNHAVVWLALVKHKCLSQGLQ